MIFQSWTWIFTIDHVFFQSTSSTSTPRSRCRPSTLETLLAITDSRLLESLGIEARFSWVSENSMTLRRRWFYGDFMVILWWFYGDFMVIYGYSMDILWIFYGYSMDILWIFYGHDAISEKSRFNPLKQDLPKWWIWWGLKPLCLVCWCYNIIYIYY